MNNEYVISLLLFFFVMGFSQPIWTWLEQISQEERENSEIQIMLEQNAGAQALQMKRNIEDLWNKGRYEDALALFPALEPLTDINEMSIGNSWREPVPTSAQGRWGDDVLISSRTSVYEHVFDIEHSSGNLVIGSELTKTYLII